MTSQEAEQVALLHELCDDVEGGGVCGDGEETDEVPMPELLQHLGLQLELTVVQHV